MTCIFKTKISPTYFLYFCRTIVLLWGHWHPCLGFLVTSPLGFKARVCSALFAQSGGIRYMFPEIHFWCYTCQPLDSQQCSRSLPHMHQQRWDLAQIRTSDRSYRRRTRYHWASDSALWLVFFFNWVKIKKLHTYQIRTEVSNLKLHFWSKQTNISYCLFWHL